MHDVHVADRLEREAIEKTHTKAVLIIKHIKSQNSTVSQKQRKNRFQVSYTSSNTSCYIQILTNLWTVHHSNEWGDPFTFRPDRFLDGSGLLLSASHPRRQRLLTFFFLSQSQLFKKKIQKTSTKVQNHLLIYFTFFKIQVIDIWIWQTIMHRGSLCKKQDVFVFCYFNADMYRNKTIGRNFESFRSSGDVARIGSSAQAIQSAVQVERCFIVS